MRWILIGFLMGLFTGFAVVCLVYANFISSIADLAPVGWVYVATGTRFPPGYYGVTNLLGIIGAPLGGILTLIVMNRHQGEISNPGYFLAVWMAGFLIGFILSMYVVFTAILPQIKIPV